MVIQNWIYMTVKWHSNSSPFYLQYFFFIYFLELWFSCHDSLALPLISFSVVMERPLLKVSGIVQETVRGIDTCLFTPAIHTLIPWQPCPSQPHSSPEQGMSCMALPWRPAAGTTGMLVCLTSTFSTSIRDLLTRAAKQTSQRHLDTVKESRLLFNFKDQSLILSACKSYLCLCRNLLVSRGLWFTQPGLSPVLSAARLMLRCAQKYSAEAWKQLTVSQGALFSNRSIFLRLLW